ncbi:MAG: hypothetical protein ACJ8DS_12705 [Microvirga sp.]
MATTTLHHFSPLATAAPARELLRQLWDRLSARRRRRAERDIGRYVAQRGGKFTDSLERDVERRFLFGGWPSASSSGRG